MASHFPCLSDNLFPANATSILGGSMRSMVREANTNLVTASQINAEGIHVWPFDSAFPVDVIHHNLSGRQPFRMNRHDYLEFVYINSGNLVWQVRDSYVTQHKGDLFVVSGPIYHRVTEKSSQLASVESMFFLPDLLRSSSGNDSEHLNYFLRQGSSETQLIKASDDVSEEIIRMIRLIGHELPANSDRARLFVRTYIKMILVLLMVHAGPASNTVTAPDRRNSALDRFKSLFEFLENGYQDQITPKKASDIVNMSPSNFRRAFKQMTGQSFVDYLNHFRIAKAQELLATTNMPITDVSLEVGFCDQSYFGMIFRRLAKSTPRHYRQQAIESRSVKFQSPLIHGKNDGPAKRKSKNLTAKKSAQSRSGLE